MKTMLKLAATTMLATLALAAPAQAKETPPPAAAPKPFTLPQLTDFTLPNGMKVTLAQHGNVPKVTILATIRTGNIDDGGNVWLADLTGGVMQKGAGGKDASQLAELAAGMGGSLSLSTGVDSSSAVIDVLADSAPAAIGLLADLLQRPDFKPEELEKVRADMLRNLAIARSTPGSQAAEAFAAALYPGHPYGMVFPTAAQLQGYTLDEVKAFHAANFGAARSHLYVVGRFDQATMRVAIEKAFGGWAAGNAPTQLPAPAAPPAKVTLIDRTGAPQSVVLIGRPVAKPGEAIDIKASSTLLGGYFSSRITRNIREDKGYTYSPRASLSEQVQGASWTEEAAITSEATGPAITEIFKEIRRMQDSQPTPAEVQGIKNYMNGNFVLGLSSRNGLAGSLASLDVLGLGANYLNTYVGKVSALTAADFEAAAKRELGVDGMNVVIVGPLDSVRPQLATVPEIAAKLPK
ncbi:m16 family peptidase [Novosphingobium sp. Rr 2-17]|uniref:M16 family metallopeptidase n=1 Tax=Novosphingobium sp. Rr 2-17 TaxID=555793 RepID=UPI0002698BC1|nr:pitrilysin family protein [Novosphingobium sp. Rr 2-17]EIZ79264.1 m16 family peptidase [Novosphingobium sp. Rr 2-17]